MAQPDTIPGEEKSAEALARREQERAGKKAALAAEEAAEVDALDILREAAEGALQEKAVQKIEKENKGNMREALKERAKELARTQLYYADSWHKLTDETSGTLLDIDNLAAGVGDQNILERYQADFPTISMDDFAFLAVRYRQEIIHLLVDAQGKTPQEYNKVLKEREAYEKKYEAAQVLFVTRLKEILSSIKPEQPASIIFLSQERYEDVKEVTCSLQYDQIKKLGSALEKDSWHLSEIYNLLPPSDGGFRFTKDAMIQMAEKGYPKVV